MTMHGKHFPLPKALSLLFAPDSAADPCARLGRQIQWEPGGIFSLGCAAKEAPSWSWPWSMGPSTAVIFPRAQINDDIPKIFLEKLIKMSENSKPPLSS